MGKMLDTFRTNGDSQVYLSTPRSARLQSAQPIEQEAPMPFIEVGPRREVAGSPDVMAVPLPRPALTPTPPSTPAATPVRAPQVTFRSLPGQEHLVPPRRGMAPELVAYHAAGQPAAEVYTDLLQTLRTTAQTLRGPDCKLLLFTPIATEIGATTAVLNLAIAAARSGKSVLVIDAHLRRPAVASKVGLSEQPGLMEVLAGTCKLQEAIRPTVLPGLQVLSSGAPTPLWADAESLRDLFAEVAEQFDLVLVDGPCWERRSVGLLASACEAVFLVVASSQADAPAAQELVRELPRRGIPLAGCLLTQV